ncbi:MAG: (Fe-S)-binding protein [Calditrichaeota bacterium]|nr:MAG: (Fe-S)-binding protein [Calditrichota bacterium]
MSTPEHYDQLINCMHCGLCLPVCPTYTITGEERESPRGRIRLMKSVEDGLLDITPGYMASLDLCLDCQACVSACPAGVAYGDLLEKARADIYRHKKKQEQIPVVQKLTLGWLFTRQSRLRMVGRLMALYQKSGLKSLLDKTGLLRLFSKKLNELHRLMPPVDMSRQYMRATPSVPHTLRVGLVTGCVQDVFFSAVNRDTAEVLTRNHYAVYIPDGQNCCGSVAGHNGDAETAARLARELIDAFYNKVDFVIINAAGCGSFMKKYHHLLADDPAYAAKAKWFAEHTRDIMEFLAEQGFEAPENGIDQTVTYHEPCHLTHAQKIKDAPRRVLRKLPGIDFRELKESDWCCGSAGVYNITHYDTSMVLLDRKMEHIKESGAGIVVTGNPGCIIQLQYGNKRHGVAPRVLHPVSLINRLYQQSPKRNNHE